MLQISVIVPVYNVEPYLRQCVDSILSQSFADFELILVDDGSPDNCGTICEEYAKKDSRIHVIHQKNGGLSAARNAGIDWVFANSNSEWITFIDSDDAVSSDYLSLLLDTLQREHADISACGMFEFNNDKDLPHNHECSDNTTVFQGINACFDVYSDYSKVGISAWGKLYNRALFSDTRFPVGKLHEDQAVVPILLYQASLVAISERKLYYYRVRSDSIMHEEFSVRRFDDLDAVDACIAFFSSHNEQDLVELAQRRKGILKANYNLYAIIDGVHREVPSQYRMSEFAALRYLRKTLPDQKYTYQLAKIHPKWVLLHEYIRKIKQILHIPCN